jgi:hypothetical protein
MTVGVGTAPSHPRHVAGVSGPRSVEFGTFIDATERVSGPPDTRSLRLRESPLRGAHNREKPCWQRSRQHRHERRARRDPRPVCARRPACRIRPGPGARA